MSEVLTGEEEAHLHACLTGLPRGSFDRLFATIDHYRSLLREAHHVGLKMRILASTWSPDPTEPVEEINALLSRIHEALGEG